MGKRVPMRGRSALVVLGFACTLTGCFRSSADATESDKTRARAACAKDPEYQEQESEEAETTLARYCADHACPGRAKIAALCVFRSKKAQGGASYEAETTIAPGDSATEQQVCTTVRKAGAVPFFGVLEVYCKNDKRCMTCGGSGR